MTGEVYQPAAPLGAAGVVAMLTVGAGDSSVSGTTTSNSPVVSLPAASVAV